MTREAASAPWPAGSAPVAVVMISLNEGHNMESVLNNLSGWAQEIFLVDSCSQDDTVDIALRRSVHVVQRPFKGFGDQWNFALRALPITAPWTMKLDPDERLSEELKANLGAAMARGAAAGFSIERRLWFLNKPLPVRQELIRVWKTGKCRFTDVAVNEHPFVDGSVEHVTGDLEHYDSPDLDHWLEKQNRYTTAEAVAAYKGDALAAPPSLLGNALQRRMWAKRHYVRLPFRYQLIFLYFWLWRGAWRAGWAGYVSARMWCDVYRLIEYKRREMEITGRLPAKRGYGPGAPDKRVQHFG